MVIICLASRGLVYSKCVESVFNGIEAIKKAGIPVYDKPVMSHDLPIPDAQNYITQTALDLGATQIIYLEEDHYNDPAAWVALASHPGDIATLQYNDKNGSPHGIIHFNERHDILWCGMGSTKVRRSVLEAVGSPYFRDDVRYRIKRKRTDENGVQIITEYEELPNRSPYGYGGQDVDFFTRVRQKGFVIHQIEGMRSIHMKIVQMGDAATNKGVHQITAV